MALASFSDFVAYWVVTGASSPIPDQGTNSLDMTLSGGATVPRNASYSRVRGAEFRTSSFSATSPVQYRTTTSLYANFYASSKIKSCTLLMRIRPQRTGSTAPEYCVVGGLYSDTNEGTSLSLFNQPLLVMVPAAAGSSKLLVFVGDKVFDTEYATQDSGPASTTPITDEGWNNIAVVVNGSTTVNNKIDSVVVYTESPTGVRRKYSLGARKAGARLNWSGQPSDGDTITITPDGGGAETFTAKTALGGTAATSTVVGSGTNPANGETISIDGITYTFVTSLVGAKATGVIEVNVANAFKTEVKKGEVYIRVGGYDFFLIWGTEHVRDKGAGYMDGVGSDTVNQGQYLVDYLNGVYNSNDSRFHAPAKPNRSGAGEYTSDNGQDWSSPSRTINWIATGPVSGVSTREVTIEAASMGALQIPIVVVDGWKWGATGSQTGKPTNWRVRVKSGTVDNPGGGLWATYDDSNGKTQGVTKGGADAAPAYAVKIESAWLTGGGHGLGTRENLRLAILKATSGGSGEDVYYKGVTVANPGVSAAAASGVNDLLLTSSYAGEAGNGKVVSDTSAQLTTANFAGGATGASDPRYFKIGATAAETWGNLVHCFNGTGSKGLDYGNGSSAADAYYTAAAGSSYISLRRKTAGAAGNTGTIAKSCSAITSIRDEFNDATQTTFTGGCDSGAWTVGAGARPDNADLKMVVGGLDWTPAGTKPIFYGVISDCAIANRAITDGEFADWVYTPPPVSTRDRGWYRAAARMSYSAKTETMSSWRGLVRLPVGLLNPRFPIGLNGSRCAFRIWGVEAGRPFALNRLAVEHYTRGGLGGAKRMIYGFPPLQGGVDRSTQKDVIRPMAMADAKNISLHNKSPRRRRGYKVLAQASGSDHYPMAFFDATTASGEVYHLVYWGGALYSYDNGILTEIDTGWPPNELPTVATVGEKTFIATTSRTRVFSAGSVFEPGVDAPTDAPALISLTPTADAVIVTKPGWEYVVTYYDGTHQTDSGPSPSCLILRADDTEPSTVKLSIPVSPSGTVTKRKLWKRRPGNDVHFLVAVIDDNTTTDYTDTADQPSAITLESFNGVDVTAEWPDYTAVGEHEGRLVGFRGSDRRVVAYSEVGDGERWYPLNTFRAKHEVRACASHEGRHFIFTDRSTEVLEGDWVRGSSGALAVTHKVLDTSKGAFGPFSVCVGRGLLIWADPTGIHAMGRGNDQQDVTNTFSWNVHPYVQNAIDTSGTNVVLEFNHVSQDVWICITQANPDGDTKNRITLICNLETGQWTPYDHSLSWVCRVNDGLFGQQFYGCDYLGDLLELDVLDGDGIEGNESWFSAGGISITSISGNTLNFTATSLPTTLRGVSVVLEDTSSANTPYYRRTILSSTATSITLDSVPSAIAALDKAHIGGIIGMVETAEIDLGTPNLKTWHFASASFSDLTVADY